MSDNDWSQFVEDRSVDPVDASAVVAAAHPDRISQAESFRDLGFAIAGMLTVALLANLIVLSL